MGESLSLKTYYILLNDKKYFSIIFQEYYITKYSILSYNINIIFESVAAFLLIIYRVSKNTNKS